MVWSVCGNHVLCSHALRRRDAEDAKAIAQHLPRGQHECKARVAQWGIFDDEGVFGDVGGFDAASQFTWQAMAGFGYNFQQYGSLLLGYRAIGTDYTNNGFTYNIIAHGPLLAYEFKF